MNIERRAFLLAMKAHERQLYGVDPYMVHLFDVVKALRRHGHTQEELLSAAWLHDIIEDTPFNYADVRSECGTDVAEIVLALTDEVGRNRKERKAKTLPKLSGNFEAQCVKLADWIANVENAISEKPQLVQMYQKDWKDFAEAYWGAYNQLDPMWMHLESLLRPR